MAHDMRRKADMNEETVIEKFFSLVDFDQLMKKTHVQIDKVQQEIDAIRGAHQEEVHKAELLKQHKIEAQKKMHQYELEMKTLDQQEQEKKAQLNKTQDRKEYLLFQKEIASLKQQQYDIEDILLKVWEEQEQINKEYEKALNLVKEKEKELEAKVLDKQKSKELLENKLHQFEHERLDHEKGIPEDILDKYTRMFHQVDDPVVDVSNGSCGACFYTITQQDLIQLKKRKLMQCKMCYRFLRYKPS
ncbi:MAG: hypothetical protein WBQ73_02290 [Candidatus Babeliales bacterium]